MYQFFTKKNYDSLTIQSSMIRSLVVYICVQGPSSALFSVKVIPLGFCILSSCQLHNVFLARYDSLTPLGLQMKQWGQNTPLEYMWATHQCVISKCIYNQHVQHWWSSRTHFLNFLMYSVARLVLFNSASEATKHRGTILYLTRTGDYAHMTKWIWECVMQHPAYTQGKILQWKIK